MVDKTTEHTNGKHSSRRRFLRAAAGGTAVSSLAGCMGGIGGGSNTYKIGACLPLSQGWGPYGRTTANAAKLAVKQINEAGGLNGKDVEIIVEDNQVDPKVVQEKTKKLVKQDNVDILFGPLSSTSRNAMSPLLEQYKIPLIYPVEYEGTAAKDYCNKWIFKTGEVPPQQVEPFVPWLLDNYGKDVYLFGNDYVWAREVDKITKRVVKNNGGNVVAHEYVQLGTTDLSSAAARIKDKDPDLLIMTLTGSSVVAMMKELSNRGMRDSLQEVGWDFSSTVLSGLSTQASKGILSCHPYFKNIPTKQNKQFKKEFRSEFGGDAEINFITGTAYIGIQLLQQAVKDMGSTKQEDVIKGMEKAVVKNSLFGGNKQYKHDHQLEHSCYIGKFGQNKEYQTVKQLAPAMPEETCSSF